MRKIIEFKNDVSFVSSAAVGSREERLGPLSCGFDFFEDSGRFGEKSWEAAEAELSRLSLNFALKKARGRVELSSLDVILAGDLENQCTATSRGLYSFGIPFVGLYSACSTLSEGLLILSNLISSSAVKSGAVVTSSHNSAAERQFRTPIEYGGQRTPTAQWTATAGGAFILSSGGGNIKIKAALLPKVVDGLTPDATNMGGAMARAAYDSIYTFFALSEKSPRDFDFIVTGDLGKYGSLILEELLDRDCKGASKIHLDCGNLLYDLNSQDCHAGASGCGCSAAVLSSHFLPLLENGKIKNILFLSTGALMSPTSTLQGENILGIAPLVWIGRD